MSRAWGQRFRYDHDLECMVQVGGNYFEERPEGPSIISDDVGAGVNGLRHMASGKMLDSKSEHRKENRRRGLEEVGNETNFASKKAQPHPDDYMREVVTARQQIAGDWNGTRGWLEHENRKSRG